jgi:xanthine dehydrogenase molybdopterin-binding subunit B
VTIMQNDLDKVDRELGLQGLTLCREVAKSWAENAAEESPVRTGFLKSRNQHQMEGDEAVAFNDAPYAAAVNFGDMMSDGRFRAPNAFWDRGRERMITQMETLIDRAFGGR